MSFRDVQNPGIGGLDELTLTEETFVQTGAAGVILLLETTAPSATSGFGKLYVKSSDSELYFKDDGGTETQLSGGASGANTALSNLASVAINTTLVSDTDNTDALGTTAIAWSDLFLGSGAVITFNSAPSTADITLTHSANTLTFDGGTLALGANSLTMTGSLAATAARVTKGWFTDVESTNMPTVGGTSLSSTFAPIASPTFTGTVTLPVGLTGVLRADTGVVSTDSDVTDLVSASSTTLAGKIEIATGTEVDTGTDDTRAISPLGLQSITALPVLDTILTTLTGVIRADAGVLAVDTDVTDLVSAASLTLAGKVELATTTETNTGTDTTRAVTPDGLSSAVRSIMLTAQGGAPLTTAGCSQTTKVEAATNDINYWVMDFDTTTEEHAFWAFPMPENWDAGTVTAQFYWTNAAGLTTETVDWGIAGGSWGNDDAIDAALGTEVTTTDTWLAQGDIHISPKSTAITIANAAAGEWVNIVVARKVASDNMTGDARLIAVKIEYTIDQYSDSI